MQPSSGVNKGTHRTLFKKAMEVVDGGFVNKVKVMKITKKNHKFTWFQASKIS